jgi:hypothetical protein
MRKWKNSFVVRDKIYINILIHEISFLKKSKRGYRPQIGNASFSQPQKPMTTMLLLILFCIQSFFFICNANDDVNIEPEGCDDQQQSIEQPSNNATTAKIAIIGGGIAGTAFAHYVSKSMPNVDITLYESSDRIGGRLRFVNVGGDNNQQTTPIEVGGSIFVQVNQLIEQLIKEFKLKKFVLNIYLICVGEKKKKKKSEIKLFHFYYRTELEEINL